MDELIDLAVEISINGGNETDVWLKLNGRYGAFGDDLYEVHMAVLDGADVIVRGMYPSPGV